MKITKPDNMKMIAALTDATIALKFMDDQWCDSRGKLVKRNPETGWRSDELCEAYSTLFNELASLTMKADRQREPFTGPHNLFS